MARLVVLLACTLRAEGQLSGTVVEMPPPVDVAHCTKSGCRLEQANATLDANWRWIHGQQCSGIGKHRQCYSAGNCYTNGMWDKGQCPDPQTCAENCVLEAVTAEQYAGTYGVSAIEGGVELKFVTGQNVGSRLYLTEAGGERYKLFRLKNREFAFDVDVSSLSCGINGAVYFSEMEVSGGLGGGNKAGAKFGTGYCDAQCPHDVKFIDGEANILDWNVTTSFGGYGACCAEMDIWEANKRSAAYTTHPCSAKGTTKCTGLDCGGLPDETEHRYKGLCDKDGCDFNAFRNGDKSFFGEGSEYTLDSGKPFTVVTQWITSDGTDDGDLVEIRRLYVQGGRVIQNSQASILPGQSGSGNSITDQYCNAQKAAFHDPDEHARKGGLKSMGEALERGVVLVLSLWDDGLSHMLWLDSEQGNRSHPTGTLRGPCGNTSGAPAEVRALHGSASVKYTNFMYGELDTTYTAKESAKPAAAPQRQQPAQRSSQPAPQQQQPAANRQQASLGGDGGAYSQCGGKTWTGPTHCQDGCTCVAQGDYYSQCTPAAGSSICGAEESLIILKASSDDLARVAAVDPAGGLQPNRVKALAAAAVLASLSAVAVSLAGARAHPAEGHACEGDLLLQAGRCEDA